MDFSKSRKHHLRQFTIAGHALNTRKQSDMLANVFDRYRHLASIMTTCAHCAAFVVMLVVANSAFVESVTLDCKGKGSFYIAQYPVRWTAQGALHILPPLADLFIPTPTRLLREAF